MRRVFFAATLLLWPAAAGADWQDQERASNMIGFARATAAACPSLRVLPAWVQSVVSRLLPQDQAAIAGNPIYMKPAERHAAELLAQMADPCRAGLDFEAKLGEQVFKKLP